MYCCAYSPYISTSNFNWSVMIAINSYLTNLLFHYRMKLKERLKIPPKITIGFQVGDQCVFYKILHTRKYITWICFNVKISLKVSDHLWRLSLMCGGLIVSVITDALASFADSLQNYLFYTNAFFSKSCSSLPPPPHTHIHFHYGPQVIETYVGPGCILHRTCNEPCKPQLIWFDLWSDSVILHLIITIIIKAIIIFNLFLFYSRHIQTQW